MEKKFSKGKWSVEEDTSYNGIHLIWCESELSHIPKLVARTCFATDSIANAKLIAAAPEMLDILSTIENDNLEIPDWLWKRIKDVIKKATE